MLARQEGRRVEWHCIAPGKPTDNSFIESFNSKFRAIARHVTRPSGQSQRRKRTQNWIKLGGNVSQL